MKITQIDSKNTVENSHKIRTSFAWVLFLGVIPFDKAALALYINASLGEYISYALNALTLFIAFFLILNGSAKKGIKNKLFIKYVLYFVSLLFIYLMNSLISSDIAIRRILSLICLLFYYLFVICKYDSIYELLQDIKTALLVIVITSLILYLMGNPNVFYRESTTKLTFKGIAANRNSYAEVTMFLIVSSFCVYKKEGNFFSFAISVGLAIYTTLLTNSATATICIILLSCSLLLISFKRIAKHLSVSLFAFVYIAVFVFLILFQNTDSWIFQWVTETFNKDVTFTGRTDLWSAAMNAISKRPIFGYGYDSDVLLSYGMGYADPHNSILYILLTEGIIGLLSFGGMIIGLFVKKKDSELRTNYIYAYMLIFFMIWLIRGLVESGCSYSHFLFWLAIIVLDRLQLENEVKLQLENGVTNAENR